MGVTTKLFLSILDRFTDDQLKQAIDARVNLLGLAAQRQPGLIRTVRLVSGLHRKEKKDAYTLEKFLLDLSELRPKTYAIIYVHPGGISWLKGNFEEFKKNVF